MCVCLRPLWLCKDPLFMRLCASLCLGAFWSPPNPIQGLNEVPYVCRKMTDVHVCLCVYKADRDFAKLPMLRVLWSLSQFIGALWSPLLQCFMKPLTYALHKTLSLGTSGSSYTRVFCKGLAGVLHGAPCLKLHEISRSAQKSHVCHPHPFLEGIDWHFLICMVVIFAYLPPHGDRGLIKMPLLCVSGNFTPFLAKIFC